MLSVRTLPKVNPTCSLLRLLSEHPELSHRQLAYQLGTSLGAVYKCLKALTAEGHIEVGNFAANPNKMPYAYLLTPEGLHAEAELTGNFLSCALREHEALRQEVESSRQEVAASDALASDTGRSDPKGDRVEKACENSRPIQTGVRK